MSSEPIPRAHHVRSPEVTLDQLARREWEYARKRFPEPSQFGAENSPDGIASVPKQSQQQDNSGKVQAA